MIGSYPLAWHQCSRFDQLCSTCQPPADFGGRAGIEIPVSVTVHADCTDPATWG